MSRTWILVIGLIVVFGCGGATSQSSPEAAPVDGDTVDPPEESADPPAASVASPDPFDPLRELMAALRADDLDGIVASFHPVLHEDVRRELGEEGRGSNAFARVQVCLQTALDIGESQAIEEVPPRITEAGITGDLVEISTHAELERHGLVVLHEGRYVLVDTGC